MAEIAPEIHWKVAGKAGEGIDVTGIMFGKLCLRHGMSVFTYREYPSLIRGGHNTHQVHARFAPITCQQKHIDVLIAFNEEGISLHTDEIDATSIVLFEQPQTPIDIAKYSATQATFVEIPMTKIARETTGHFLAQNVVALGASTYLFGLQHELLATIIREQFEKKGEEVINANLKALEAGFAYAKEHCKPKVTTPVAPQPRPQVLMTGNQVVGTAALAAGVQYCSMYPMTPTSEILHFLAAQQHRFPLVVKHVEDEIAAINQAIGASYMGARAMTASATGGYALMVEGTSLAGIAETPLVIVVGQRPGPATGLPTWTCQSDLQFVLNAGHGEIPRVVLTPGSPEEHYTLTKLAFELAERFHLVVFVLSDKFALESYASMTTPEPKTQNERFGFVSETLPADNSYRRFVDTSEGWSPRSVPGQAHGLSITNSYEHDAFGYATEDAVIAKQMNQKRLRKLATVAPLVPKPVVIGAATATTTLVCWGSTRLVVEEVIRRGALQQHSINAIHFPCIWPFPKEEFLSAVAGAKRVVVVEGNQTGQLEQLIRQETGIVADRHIRRFDGRPFFAEEVLQEIQQG